MAAYFVNDGTDERGDHEVHVVSCTRLPRHRTALGDFSSCPPAVAKARTIYTRVNGCYWCSRPCHTT